MKKKRTATVVGLVVVVVIVGGLGYHFLTKEISPPPGERTFELPSWENAARWSFSLFSEIENMRYTMIVRFVGESVIEEKSYYQLDYFFDPPMGGFLTMSKAWLKKDALVPVKIQYFQGDNFLSEIVITYMFSENMWPLKVGKEFTLIENRIVEGMTQSYLVKVDAIEDVITPAGTFECPKIVYYRDNIIAKTEWYASQIGWYVKTVDNQFKRVIELQSY